MYALSRKCPKWLIIALRKLIRERPQYKSHQGRQMPSMMLPSVKNNVPFCSSSLSDLLFLCTRQHFCIAWCLSCLRDTVLRADWQDVQTRRRLIFLVQSAYQTYVLQEQRLVKGLYCWKDCLMWSAYTLQHLIILFQWSAIWAKESFGRWYLYAEFAVPWR